MKYLLLSLTALIILSCEFTVNTKPETEAAASQSRGTKGFATKKNGLDCASVYWETKHRKTDLNSFVFGEEIMITFDDVKGLTKKNGKYKPYISLVIVGSSGDTVLMVNDIAKKIGNSSNVQLFASFSIGRPFRSNASYTALIGIEDYNGSGSMSTRFRFETVSDNHIKTIKKEARVDEVYLVDGTEQSAVVTGEIPLNHDIYLIMEGLQGFSEIDGKCDIGVSMVGTSPSGRILFNIADATESMLVSSTDLNLRLTSPAFTLKQEGKGKMLLEVTVWDKRGPAKVTSSVYLGMKK